MTTCPWYCVPSPDHNVQLVNANLLIGMPACVCIVAHIASTSSGRKIYLECEGFERESMNLNLGKSWQRRFGVAPWDENTIAIYEFPV